MNITSITKDGTKYIITLEDKNNPCTFDSKSYEFTSYTGRTVKNFPAYLNENANEFGSLDEYLLDAIKAIMSRQWNYRRYKKWLNSLNLFYANADLIENFRYLPDTCPKGYINYLKENNLKISLQSFNTFINARRECELCTEDRKLFHELNKQMTNFYSNYAYNTFVREISKEQLHIFLKIVRVSIKSVDLNMGNTISDFINLITTNYKTFNPYDFIDTNRDLRYNIKLLQKTIEQRKNDLIIATEDKIRDIENLFDDTFSIVVPKSLEDFSDEGKQQNNCVGYYYHDNIARGEDIIYFIRNKNNIEHSLYTCRYNVQDEYTVEKRAVNNSIIKNKKALEFIDKIDNFIKNNCNLKGA